MSGEPEERLQSGAAGFVPAHPNSMPDGSQGFRPYTARKAAQEGREGTGGNGNGDADSPRGGTTSTHLSPSMLGGTAAGAAAAGADHNLAGGHHHHGDGGGAECAAAAADLSDRNRSISSAHRGAQHAGLMGGGGQPGLRQPQPGLVPGGLSHFTAGFPPGPQQQLLAQLPWFAQLQNAQAHMDSGAASDPMAAAMAAAATRFRSGSFASELQDRLPSLGSQPSAGGARPKRKSTLSLSVGDVDGDFLDSGGDPDGAGRFDSMGAGMEEGEEEEDAESRTRRRLAQNREAARKSRQRRKQYVARLEAEVRQLRHQVAQQGAGGGKGGAGGNAGGAASAPGGRAASVVGRHSISTPNRGTRSVGGQPEGVAGRRPSLASSPGPCEAGAVGDALGDLGTSAGHVEILAAFARWRAEHAATAGAVRAALQGGLAQETQLRALADEARSQLWGLFQMKRAVVYSEGVGLIAGLAHLPPAERPFAWLGAGPLRPSEAAGGLLARLPPGVGSRPAMQLQILKESLAQQEAMLAAGYDSVTAELRGHAARAEGLGAAPWSSPEVLGRLDALRTLLLQADGLWQQFLEETQRVLPLAQAAQAAIAMAEASAQLQALQGPWLPLGGQQQQQAQQQAQQQQAAAAAHQQHQQQQR